MLAFIGNADVTIICERSDIADVTGVTLIPDNVDMVDVTVALHDLSSPLVLVGCRAACGHSLQVRAMVPASGLLMHCT